MKKFWIGALIIALAACNNDGAREGDTNGALNDNGGPLTDTARGIENRTRTDIQQRDTFTTEGQ
jgi:hypothetical protein